MHSLYSEQRTWLHGVPAGWKLLLLTVLCTALFQLQSWQLLLACTVACALLLASLGRVALGAWRLLRALLVAGALIAAFHAYLHQPQVGVSSALRLLCTASLGTVLTLTTRYSDLLAVIEWLLTPLARFGVRPDRLALQLALMLRFVEHFLVQWTRLDEAYRVRSGRRGGWRLLAPLAIQMLVSARRVADTLYLRIR